ncbi:MAG: hypothetical protein ACUVSX_01810 [Aggregatilineales bacterium]
MRLSQPRPLRPDSKAQHLRETRRQILLPLLAGTLLIVVLVGVVLILPRRAQVSIISDFLLTLFVLCPAAVCLLPVTIGLLVAAFGAGRLHDSAAPPLRSLQARTAAMSDRTAALADAVNRRVVAYGGRLGAALRAFDAFEHKQPTAVDEETTNE